ncbi:MAG: hypothetical protein EXQ95_03735 [Alphaproteobacteria bacterium]|nr:hypothetical protein [Alphaproteobacteria bacterium]
MEITPLIPDGRQVIESYGDGRFRVSGVAIEGSLLVMPTVTFSWSAVDASTMTLESLAPVLAADPPIEILLVGCGKRLVPLAPALKSALRDRGIGADPMDTGAACRTYNVLMAEGRRVAVALLPV